MTTLTNWKHPDWIYLVQEKLNHIDLSKFPSHIGITSKVIEPKDNKYISEWALCINVKLEIRLRDTGQKTTLVNPEGVYLYSEKNFEEIIYVEIERLLCHELKECFQIKEYRPNPNGAGYNGAIIPFDPHNDKRARIKYSTYDKVDIYRHYPSWRTLMKLSIVKWWKKNANVIRTYYTSRWQIIADHIHKLIFVEPKELPMTIKKDNPLLPIDFKIIDVKSNNT